MLINEEFISLVEDIHMHSRMLATHFYNKSREDKDMESYLRNALSELQSGISRYNVEVTLRRLF